MWQRVWKGLTRYSNNIGGIVQGGPPPHLCLPRLCGYADLEGDQHYQEYYDNKQLQWKFKILNWW